MTLADLCKVGPVYDVPIDVELMTVSDYEIFIPPNLKIFLSGAQVALVVS